MFFYLDHKKLRAIKEDFAGDTSGGCLRRDAQDILIN
jgi:hypothetical protein